MFKISSYIFWLSRVKFELKTWLALKQALKLKNTSKNLLISNWDIFYWNLNIEEYFSYHKEQKSDFSLCLKFILNPEQLWNVKIHWNKIIKFVERSKASEMNLTNSGLYITSRDFLDKHNFWDYLEKDFFLYFQIFVIIYDTFIQDNGNIYKMTLLMK